MKTKLLYFGAMSAIVVSGLLLLWIFYSLIFPIKPFEFIGGITVKTKTIKRGGTLIYTVNRCKNVDKPSLVSRTLVDSIVYNLPEVSSNLATGCGVVDVVMEIPKIIPPGIYYLRTTATYKVNPLRTFSATGVSEKFIIVE